MVVNWVRVSRKAEQAEATRTALLKAARDLFSQRGFAETPTEEIVQRAGVTRGALYHHFTSKEDLLSALVMEIGEGLAHKVAHAAKQQPDAWQGFIAGCETFLDACLDPAVQRILILDAPAALGGDAMRDIDERCWLGVTRMGLEHAIEGGFIEPQPVDTLARIMMGALYEGAKHIARSPDHKAARIEVGAVLRRFAEGFRLQQHVEQTR
jgi:AcrR family transcriptional regulator